MLSVKVRTHCLTVTRQKESRDKKQETNQETNQETKKASSVYRARLVSQSYLPLSKHPNTHPSMLLRLFFLSLPLAFALRETNALECAGGSGRGSHTRKHLFVAVRCWLFGGWK